MLKMKSRKDKFIIITEIQEQHFIQLRNGTISTEENPHPSPKSPMKQGNYKSSVQRELYVLGQAFNDMKSP